MTSARLLDLTSAQLAALYRERFPGLVRLAGQTGPEEFARELRLYARLKAGERPRGARRTALDRIDRMLEAEGKTVSDLSTGERVACSTFRTLWKALQSHADPHQVHPDFLADLFRLFEQLEEGETACVDRERAARWEERWASGLDEAVRQRRAENKKRIIERLIDRMDQGIPQHSRYVFPPGMDRDRKRELVENWWNEHRFHLAMALRSPEELNLFLGNTLPADTLDLLRRAKSRKMPFFITPYYLSLLNPGPDGYDDATVRSYVIYSPELVETYGNIRAWEKEDRVEAGRPNAAGWLLPDGGNIHRRYPEVAILIPDSMGRACGGLCAPCQRMYDFQRRNLSFDFERLKPKENWNRKLLRLMDYFEHDAQLRDILITGGDGLMSQNKTLRKLLEAVYRMAVRKREANRLRPEGEKLAEIRRVRIGSRLPAYLPMRINDELVDILREFREKASGAGIRQFFIQTHFESPLEMTPEAERAIGRLLSAGWVVTNQLVFTAAASRRGHTARLREVLNRAGVVCYYTFTVKGFRENYDLYAPVSRSMQEWTEEKAFGLLSPEEEEELLEALAHPGTFREFIPGFLERTGRPFLATDRSVLNLPAVGKSLSFDTVGLMPDGRRILRFGHDAGRRHSPIIDRLGDVHIVENKSLGAYLRRLRDLGEDPDEYDSLWAYDRGTTESRFRIYDYPPYDCRMTEEINNLCLEP